MPRRAAVLLLLAAAAGAGACGEARIDAGAAERGIKQEIEKQIPGTQVSAIECPDDIRSVKGARAVCEMTLAGGRQAEVSIRVTSGDGTVDWVMHE